MGDKQISRRNFLAGGVSLVAAAGASALLAACAPQQETPAASSATASSGSGASAAASSAQDTASAPTAPASSEEISESGIPQKVTVPKDAKVLLVYFSRPGQNNYGTGSYRELKVGYTKTVAGYMLDELKCDSFEIQAADPYSRDYRETVRRNVQEEENETYPEIANLSDLPSIDAYDVIIMGSPVWNSQSPMIMRTFLRSYDFSGKIILPFTTYDMSGLGSVPRDYAELAPRARVSDDGLAVYECDAEEAAGRKQTRAWLSDLGLAKS